MEMCNIIHKGFCLPTGRPSIRPSVMLRVPPLDYETGGLISSNCKSSISDEHAIKIRKSQY